MHLLHQQQQQQIQLFCLVFIFVNQVLSGPVTYNIRCNFFQQNCTLVPQNVSADVIPPSGHIQVIARQRTPPWSMSSTSRPRSTTRDDSSSDFDSFSENLKRAALILAGIALGLGILRICLMLCKSRSRNNSRSNRHASTVRPQIATIEHHQFKPDLPPAYAEAMANGEHEGGKLPTYEELPYEQRREQHVYNDHGYVTTQL